MQRKVFKKDHALRASLAFVLLLSAVMPSMAQTAGRMAASPRQVLSGTVQRDERLWQRALQIHRRAIVIDTHNDVTTPMTNDDYDLSGPPPEPYRTSLERMKRGGLNAEFFSLYIKPTYVKNGGAARRTLDMIDAVYRASERHPDDLMMAYSAADIREAKRRGKIAALMGIEGGHAIENSLATLREFYRLGVRYMTLTWNNTNDWADAGRGEKTHNGLTDFGKEVVREMNRMGMLVDVSHVSDKTMSDALDISKAPLIASHSSARALAEHPRNIPDDLLRRIAKNGGVVQVNFYDLFVDAKAGAANDERSKRLKPQYDAVDERFKDDPERRAEEEDKLDAANPLQPPVTLSKLVDHIDYIVKIAGIDHVGLGADFDGAMDMPEGARDVSELPNITYELLRRGYSEKDIRKILGENFLRVFAEAERIARSSSRNISGDGSLRRIK
ncbi:MAG TPA: dipeptidase [Pyrinomonadaceae bacterium]|jgi:membrane dipeptidase|nr:dipeptidase [Pyrinomonadaceae bacterium]